MVHLGIRWALASIVAVSSLACGPTVGAGTETDDGTGTTGTGTTGGPTSLDSSPYSSDDANVADMGPEEEEECPPGRLHCTSKLDVLVVMDNSRTMSEEQRAFARYAPEFVDDLVGLQGNDGAPLKFDLQLMVTTTDVDNPLCTALQPPGYAPAMGAPVSTACVDRLDDFTDLSGTINAEDVCLEVCPSGAAPDGPFMRFGSGDSNIPPGSDAGDVLACIVPQGINGCGYESPLEAMRLALDPAAPHNSGDQPFLRPDAALAIVLVTDELDCSVADPSMMRDASLYSVNPETGTPAPSSAICWNAGVECDGPDAMGVYFGCASSEEVRMHSVEGYIEYLRGDLFEGQEKDVMMLPLVGVPPVVMHDPDPPFEPVAGGEYDLWYRRWRDGVYPAGDILPDEAAQGITAADKEFDFGMGPGCIGSDDGGTIMGPAVAPTRMLEVCHGLDTVDPVDPAQVEVRCCVESICDDDYRGLGLCIQGMVIEGRPSGLGPGKG